jgi:hypothetical protein
LVCIQVGHTCATKIHRSQLVFSWILRTQLNQNLASGLWNLYDVDQAHQFI